MRAFSSELLTLLEAFEKGGSDEELESIIDALAAMATDESIATLCELVDDPFSPQHLRFSALRACSYLPHQQTTLLFLKMLHSSSLQNQQLAIHTLGCWRVRRAVPKLAQRLRRQHQTAESRLLLMALSRIGTDDALLTIQQWLHEADEKSLSKRLHCLSSIPERSLLSILSSFCEWASPAYRAEAEQAMKELKKTIQEDVEKRLLPFQQQMEEGLF